MGCLKIAAVVPIKDLEQSKSRLSSVLRKDQRQKLVIKMLGRLLTVLTQESVIDAVYVITPDPAVGEYLHTYFPQVRLLLNAADLNKAAEVSANALLEDGYSSMLFLFGDLPFLTSNDLRAAVKAAKDNSVVLMPDRKRMGTNGMVLTPPGCMDTCFGENSFKAHVEMAHRIGQDPYILEAYGFAQDIDLPDDLKLLMMPEKACTSGKWEYPST